jgi:hypothetical protein
MLPTPTRQQFFIPRLLFTLLIALLPTTPTKFGEGGQSITEVSTPTTRYTRCKHPMHTTEIGCAASIILVAQKPTWDVGKNNFLEDHFVWGRVVVLHRLESRITCAPNCNHRIIKEGNAIIALEILLFHFFMQLVAMPDLGFLRSKCNGNNDIKRKV